MPPETFSQLSSASRIISPCADWTGRLSARSCTLGSLASSAVRVPRGACASPRCCSGPRTRLALAPLLSVSWVLRDVRLQLRRHALLFPLVSCVQRYERLFGSSLWRLQGNLTSWSLTLLPDLDVLSDVHPSRAGNSSLPSLPARCSGGKWTPASNGVPGRVTSLAVPWQHHCCHPLFFFVGRAHSRTESTSIGGRRNMTCLFPTFLCSTLSKIRSTARETCSSFAARHFLCFPSSCVSASKRIPCLICTGHNWLTDLPSPLHLPPWHFH